MPHAFRTRYLRWLILLSLNHARPEGASDALVLQIAHAEYPDCTLSELRRELDYLARRGLVELKRPPDGGAWRAALSHHGIDVAEYTAECDPGIERPAKYWR